MASIEFKRFSGKPVKALLGTYLGVDASLGLLFGCYGSAVMNKSGITAIRLDTGQECTLPESIGVATAGVAVPIMNIQPDFEKLPSDSPLWDQLL